MRELIGDVAYEPARDIMEVYLSWIDDAISNYNSDFFYQFRDYLRECFLAGCI